MCNLKKTQQEFLNYLRQKDNNFEDYVVGTKNFDSSTRLGIYGNAYAIRLIEVLEDNYPALHTLMGDEVFEKLAYQYLAQHPSQHYSVRYFGHLLADFLHNMEEYKYTPVFAEMAEFEWALRAAFDSSDEQTITIEALQAIPPEQWGEMHFNLHPSVHRLNLRWNTPALWQAIENKQAPIPAEENEYPISWRIWREGKLKIFYKSLQVDEAWALDAIIEGNNFAEICEGLCEWIDEMNTPQRAVELISSWINDGLIINVST